MTSLLFSGQNVMSRNDAMTAVASNITTTSATTMYIFYADINKRALPNVDRACCPTPLYYNTIKYV